MMNCAPQLIESICSDAESISRLRRDIHAHPELCFEEYRTSELVARTLESWGIPVHRGVGRTGVVGVITGGRGRPAIGLRADMDALPMTESNVFAHASVYPGKMHACGHDGHTAMLLAAAKYFSSHRGFEGTIYLIFQPAEEGGGGARAMIEDGLFMRFPMDAVFGIHNWPGLGVGQFAVRSGPVFASSSEFRVTIHGKGTHAAMPHNGTDPVPIGCQLVQAFQTIITRNMRPIDTGLISVTMIHAGEAANAVPDRCELRGTVRTFTVEVLDMIERRMREIVVSTCEAFGAANEFEFSRFYPATVNHSMEATFVRNQLAALVGAGNVLEFEPTMAAEDFSFYLNEKPGCYFLIGNGHDSRYTGSAEVRSSGLHTPTYDFNDDLIALGGSMWVRLAVAWFAEL